MVKPISIETIRGIFEETKKLTNNFNYIPNNLLFNSTTLKYPAISRILLSRLSLNMNRDDFIKLLGISKQTLRIWESGLCLLKKESSSIKYMKLIKNRLPKKITWGIINNGYLEWKRDLKRHSIGVGKRAGNTTKLRYGIQYYKNIAKIGARKGGLAVLKKYGKEFYSKNGLKGGPIGGKKGGITMAKIMPLTKQEVSILNKIKKDGYFCFWKLKDYVKIYENNEKRKVHIDCFNNFSLNKYCEIRPLLKINNHSYIPDFLLVNKDKKMILECTTNKTNNMATYLNSIKLGLRSKIFCRNGYQFIVVLSENTPINPMLNLLDKTNAVFEDDFNSFLSTLDIIKIKENTIKKLYIRESSKYLAAVSVSKQILSTEQEKLIADYLQKKGYDFKYGYPIKNLFGSKHFVDFMIFKKGKPHIILETSQFKKKRDNNQTKSLISLWRTIHFSYNFYLPDTYYIGVLANSKNNLDSKRIKELNIFSSSFDALILNNNLPELNIKIRKFLDKPLEQKHKLEFNESEINSLWLKVKG